MSGPVVGREISVKVWDKHYTIKVYQKTKSVWIANGEYMGESHTTQGKSG
jgi:hypothetical protein